MNPNNPLGGASCLHDAWRRDLRPFCPSVRRVHSDGYERLSASQTASQLTSPCSHALMDFGMKIKLLTMRSVLGAVLGAMLGLSLPTQAQDQNLLPEARKVASAVPSKLLEMLNSQIAKGGPAAAVEVCNEKAPQMAKAASEQTGWAIRRVSLRNRNPKAVPDAWELEALKDFDQRAAAGEKPATLEKYGVVDTATGKEYRYMKALPTQPVCLACHGAAENFAPEVAEKLRTLYPADKATGYSVGDLRGAITLRKAM